MSDTIWLAMVALPHAVLPTAEQVADSLRTSGPDAPQTDETRQSGNVVTFNIGEAAAGLTLFPKPIPWSELDGPCACAWYWPEATDIMRRHEAHILITLIDEGRDPIRKSMLTTKLAAAVAEQSEAVGVFWGPGRLVHPVHAFLELSREMTHELLPLYLWIDFRVERQENGALRLFTTGLEPLGHKELEVCDYSGETGPLREAAYNVAYYLFAQGKTLHDGDTIGIGDGPRIEVREAPSLLDNKQDVIQLEF